MSQSWRACVPQERGLHPRRQHHSLDPPPPGLSGEAYSGKGALAQFDLETGLPLYETEPLILAFIAGIFLLSILPASGRFVEEN